MSIQTINPNTNKTIKSFEEMTQKSVDAKVAKAQVAFVDWKETSYQQRADLLHKVATLMRIKKSELAKTITLEMGKLLAQAEGEIDLSADIFDYYADHGAAFLADKVLDPEYGTAIIRRWRIIRRNALEFSVLPGSSLCSSQHYGGQYYFA